MTNYQLAKSKTPDKTSRLKRLWVILLSLFFFYSILNYYLDIKMILVNYLLYPFIFIALLLLMIKKNRQPDIAAKIIDKSQQNLKSCSLSFISLVYKLVLMIFVIAWLPGIFISGTIELSANNRTAEFTKIATHYFGNLWMMTPWPVILVYIGFFGLLSQQFGIYDIKTLVHKLYKKDYENNTIHNLLMILYNIPVMMLVSLTIVMSIYALYFAVCSYLGLTAMQGVSYVTLIFCFTTVLVVTRKAIKTLLRKYNYHQWSIFKLYYVATLGIVLWMLLYTLIASFFPFESSLALSGTYNFYKHEITMQYLFFIWVLWWFCLPVIAFALYKDLKQYNYKLAMVIACLALIFCFSLFGLTGIQQYLADIILYSFNIETLNLVMFSSVVMLGAYTIYNNKFEHDLLVMDILVKEKTSQKTRAASRIYYVQILILCLFLGMILLENIFVMYKILSFFSIVSIFLILFFFAKLFKLEKHKTTAPSKS